MERINPTANKLTHHWAMDEAAAEVLADRIDTAQAGGRLTAVTERLDEAAVVARDEYREEIGRIFTMESDRKIIIVGPCSLDAETDYTPLYEYIDELQAAYPDSLVAMRANGAKPRTSGEWTGLWYSLQPEHRDRLFGIYDEAFQRQIPILSEITQSDQLGALAPWLSGIWLGARDIRSTTLRSMASAVHLPVGIKNGVGGEPETVRQAIQAIERNSAQNEDSGIDLGTIAASPDLPGIPTGILPVGEGNTATAIIARGYKLPEGRYSNDQRREAAIKHLGEMCSLGAELDKAVIIDGSHDVPPMFNIPRNDPDRLTEALGLINAAIGAREVVDSQQLTGLLAEIGPTHGKTDANFLLNEYGKQVLSGLVGNLLSATDNRPRATA